MIKRAIIDNSALRALYLLNRVSLLHLMYDEVLVPRAVEKEFLNVSNSSQRQERTDFLLHFYEENASWFIRCNEYDQSLMQLFQMIDNIHEGEFEVMAQNVFLGAVHQIILDDKAARKFGQQQSYKICGTLSVLARLDLQFSCLDYNHSVQMLINEFQSFYSENVITQAYQKIKDELGV